MGVRGLKACASVAAADPHLARGACHRAGHFGPDPLARNDALAGSIRQAALRRDGVEPLRTKHVRGECQRTEQSEDCFVAHIEAARIGAECRHDEPAAIAGAAVFLCSSASDFVTGAGLPVDGGYSGRG